MKALPADLAEVCRRMRTERRAAVAVHENPDADAVGAAIGMLCLFALTGVDASLHVNAHERLPLADLMPAQAVRHDVPAPDVPLYALDCGGANRIALPLDGWNGTIVNIDHHRDNDGFGAVALLRPEASSTCEIVCDIAQALGIEPDAGTATALYAGMSFDSGHFRHSSTRATTFRHAAWLVDLGVDVTAVFVRLYEQRSLAALRLWARAIQTAEPVASGRALLAALTQPDYEATEADAGDTEGLVDSLRSVDGVEVAALVREEGTERRIKVSLRSDSLDVSAIAALKGGGGHRLAAGFSSDDSAEEVTAWLSSELARRLRTASS